MRPSARHRSARYLPIAILGLVIGLVIGMVWNESQASEGSRPAWNDIDVIRENTEAPKAHFVPYRSRQAALAGDSVEGSTSISLNGLWHFHYADSPSGRPAEFFKPDYDVSDWSTTPVPSNWERQGHGYAIYVNVPYPFEIDEPNVPADENPVGSYRRTFAVPDGWKDQELFLEFGAVSSAFYVWINGEYVGYSEGSKTPSEFRVTDVVTSGENTIAVEVYRWSTGSYLEDQDFWSLSGIQRDVTLTARPRTRVRDFFVHAGLVNNYADGDFVIDVELVNDEDEVIETSLLLEIRDGDRVVHAEREELALEPGANTYAHAAIIPDVAQWSAESPQQYTLLVSLSEDESGNNGESIVQRIGFRTVEIENGRFLINGRHVRLKGVNLHEHHEVHGHVIDEATMLRDIELMKAANMNAVRNSHYPHQARWYELTSEHGLYVIDEANIESHGYGYDIDKTLGNKAHWGPHHLDRTQRMLERSKNFPSVVIWSLGNEAGDGINLGATYRWIKSRDPSRPVQYETEGDIDEVGERHSDFHSSMYWRYWDLTQYAQTENDRPFLLIEYAHSMGNSTGNLKEYWDVINRHDILAGAFIWDWVDQGLLEHDEDGTPYWTYGGDYGPPDVPSSGNFNFNGIVFPDRRVQPAYWEVKYVQQYVDFVPLDLRRGDIDVRNNYDFTDLSEFALRWEVRADGRTVQSGVVSDLDVPAERAGPVRLDYDFDKLRSGPAYHLNLSLTGQAHRGLLPAGHVYASEQFELPVQTLAFALAAGKTGQSLSVLRSDTGILVSGDAFAVGFDAATGLLSSLTKSGREMLIAPLKPNFWRAPTDNDFGNYMPEWAAVWEQAGRHRTLRVLEILESNAKRVVLSAEYGFSGADGKIAADWRSVFTIHASGDIEVDNSFEKSDGLPVVPRIGMNLELDRSLDSVEWLGRGPFENYSDRNRAAFVGRYKNSVADHYVPYMRPQENGYKTDARWLSLNNGTSGLLVMSNETFGFGVHHNRLADFVPPVKIAITSEDGPGARDNAERVNMHVNDVKPRDLISLDIDYGQMGVGGDDSWGKRTLQQYSLNEKRYRYRFVLRPYAVGDERLDELVKR